MVGGFTGILLAGVSWFWAIVWMIWDYRMLATETQDSAGLGQGVMLASFLGSLIMVALYAAVGMPIGLIIGRITGKFAEKKENKVATIALFSGLFVVFLITAYLITSHLISSQIFTI